MRKFATPSVSGIADKAAQRAIKECSDALTQMSSDTDQGVVSVGDVKAGISLYKSGQGSTKGGKEVRGLSQAESVIATLLTAASGSGLDDLRSRLTTVEGLEWFRGQMNRLSSGDGALVGGDGTSVSSKPKTLDFLEFVQSDGGEIVVDATSQDKLVLLFGNAIWYGDVAPIEKEVVVDVSLDTSVTPNALKVTKETILQGAPSQSGLNGGYVTTALYSRMEGATGPHTIWTSYIAPVLSPIITLPCNGPAWCAKGGRYSFGLFNDGNNATGIALHSSQLFGFVMKF